MNFREWALPVYTILIQVVTGMFFALWVIRTSARREYPEEDVDEMSKVPVLVISFTLLMAMVGSHFHLSRPLFSFLAISNFKNSWLSREIFFTVSMFAFSSVVLFQLWFTKVSYQIKNQFGWLAVLSGMITLWCMGSIYLLPTQISWDTPATLFSIYGTAFLIGAISLVVIILMDIRFTETYDKIKSQKKAEIMQRSLKGILIAVVATIVWVVVADITQIISLQGVDTRSAQASLALVSNLYQPLLILRFSVLLVGLAVFLYFYVRVSQRRKVVSDVIGPAYMACLFVLVGEILERFLFYATHVRIGF